MHTVSAAGLLAQPGQRSVVTAVATDHEPVAIPQAGQADRRIDSSIEAWRRWSELVSYHGPWPDAVGRSALALKTLLYEEGGAIAAAATTSLPESVGGSKNYDYRYAWVRDTSFTLDAFINLELREEVHAAVSWLLQAVRTTAPDIHVFYTLGGQISRPAGDHRHSRLPAQPAGAVGKRRCRAKPARHLRRSLRHHRAVCIRWSSPRRRHRTHAGRSRRPVLRRLETQGRGTLGTIPA